MQEQAEPGEAVILPQHRHAEQAREHQEHNRAEAHQGQREREDAEFHARADTGYRDLAERFPELLTADAFCSSEARMTTGRA